MGESPDQQIDCQPNDACIGFIAAKLYTVFNDKEKLLIHSCTDCDVLTQKIINVSTQLLL
jgi:hypothetical protein